MRICVKIVDLEQYDGPQKQCRHFSAHISSIPDLPSSRIWIYLFRFLRSARSIREISSCFDFVTSDMDGISRPLLRRSDSFRLLLIARLYTFDVNSWPSNPKIMDNLDKLSVWLVLIESVSRRTMSDAVSFSMRLMASCALDPSRWSLCSEITLLEIIFLALTATSDRQLYSTSYKL
jgi:hypothetical protein